MLERLSLLMGLSAIGILSCGGSNSDNNAQSPTPDLSSAPLFRDITQASGLQFEQGYMNIGQLSDVQKFCGGAAAGDFDLDGLPDLFIVRGDIGPHLLYKNSDGNRFSEVSTDFNLIIDDHQACGPAFADIDGDGDLDLFVGGIEGSQSYLFINQVDEKGQRYFEDQTLASGLDAISATNSVSASFGDYDGDGLIDLFVSHWGSRLSDNLQHLWKNIGDGRFVNVTEETGVGAAIRAKTAVNPVMGTDVDYTFAANFADVNNDRHMDILLVADFSTSQVLINRGDGRFADARSAAVKDENGMGTTVGDFDNDGDLDWFVSAIYSIDSPGNRLYQNTASQNSGESLFIDATDSAGVQDGGWGWAACFADLNLDMWLDIFHVNGWQAAAPGFDYSDDRSRLFLSQVMSASQARVFSESARENGVVDRQEGRALVCFDADGDHDIDLLVLNNDTQSVFLYENSAAERWKSLSIELRGAAPNTQALGARVYLSAGGVTQMRETNLNSHFISHNSTEHIFGLWENASAEDVVIRWSDGKITRLSALNAGEKYTIDHPDK